MNYRKGKQIEEIDILRMDKGKLSGSSDKVAVEEPLEILIEYSSATGVMRKNISVTMRTPGHDDELAAGFLFSEGIIAKDAIRETRQLSDENRVTVVLNENELPLLANATRNFYTTSSCGICGKASIDAVNTISFFTNERDTFAIPASVFYHLQDQLDKEQSAYQETGGIHASVLYDLQGNFVSLREDVGRHNALDKVIGSALLSGRLPLKDHILFLSGRASFELVQKALQAGIKVIAAVGAPSSLAVELARESGLTLIGFLRSDRFNIYSGEQRVLNGASINQNQKRAAV